MASLLRAPRPAEPARAFAARLLSRFVSEPEQSPDHVLVLLTWRGALRLARALRPYPEKPYILAIELACEHMREPLPRAVGRTLASAYRLPVLRVHPGIDLTPSRFMLGLSGRDLCVLSGEDRLYCHVHPHPYTGRPYSLGAD